MPRGFFAGHETLGPEDVSPTVPPDSPRHSANRNGHHGLRADATLSKLTARVVVRPDGQLVTLPRAVPIKPGWRTATPDDIARAESTAQRQADEAGEPRPVPRSPTHAWWRDYRGQRVRIANSVPRESLEAKGFTFLHDDVPHVAPSDIDVPHETDDGRTLTKRDHLIDELDRAAYEVKPGRHYTGKRYSLLNEGEPGVLHETKDDSAIVETRKPDGTRMADTIGKGTKKP